MLKMILAAVTLALLAAVSGVQAQARLDFAIFHPERNFWSVTLKWWIEEVEKQTQGRVKPVPHYAGSLVSMNETLRSVRDGAVPMGVVAMGAISGHLPSVAYIEAIGGMPDNPVAFVQSQEKLRPVLEAQFRGQNVEYLWSQGSGPLNVACRNRHLRGPDDWKGRKVRTAGRWQVEQIRALGASPVSMDPGEMYIALQNRTIDCALGNNVLTLGFKLHEVAPKITVLRSPVNLSAYIINSAEFARISPQDRETMKRVGAAAERRSAEYLVKATNDAAEQMKLQRADVYMLNEAEFAAFRSAIRTAFSKMDAETGPAGKQIADVLRRYW
ncbi:MAG: TRAP transporter substrate-binding protein DctP [Betaproteobacteria bacterium]|nr:TRAP transporter substrate-binding protein DctP [Betaproteobacteria bacterium]